MNTNKNLKDLICKTLGITEVERNLIEISGYGFTLDVESIGELPYHPVGTAPNIQIVLESNNQYAVLTNTNHGNQVVNVTDQVLAMINEFRKMRNEWESQT